MNLRLDPRLASALREESQRTGVSQQELVRTALERVLAEQALRSDRQRAIEAGLVTAGEPYRRVPGRISLTGELSPEEALWLVRRGEPS